MRHRKDGYASWCKGCSNTARKEHKKSAKKREYRVVATVAAQGKPTTCPCCKKTDIPTHKMRGHVTAEGHIRWACVSCRTEAITNARQVTLYCDWCCDPFSVALSQRHTRFCGDGCLHTWQKVKAARASST